MKKVVITVEFNDADYADIDRALRADGTIGLDAEDVADYLKNEILSGMDYDGFRWVRAEAEVGNG